MRSNAEAASGRLDAALADAMAAVRLDPTRADAWLALAKVKESLNHPSADWVADYRRAAGLNPTFTSLYQEALARAQGVSRQVVEGAEARGEAAKTERDRLLVYGALAVGGVLLAWGAASFLRRPKDRDEA